MDELDQEPEEIPMEDVLAEIRHMLSKEILSPTASVEGAVSSAKSVQKPADVSSVERENLPPPSPSERSSISDTSKPDYFLLTPAMRCDIPIGAPSEAIQRQAQRVLSKLQQESRQPETLSPVLIAWLNANLPQMIEKVLAQKLHHS